MKSMPLELINKILMFRAKHDVVELLQKQKLLTLCTKDENSFIVSCKTFEYGENKYENCIYVQDDIYLLLIDYFSNPELTKVKDFLQYSIYACVTYHFRYPRYIILTVIKDNKNIGAVEKLNTIRWLSLQTREQPRNVFNIVIRSHHHTPHNDVKLMDCEIEKVTKSKNFCNYLCKQIPVAVTLLYPNYVTKGNIMFALETWNTIITFV